MTFSARIRVTVRDEAQLVEKFAPSLAARGMFIRHDSPPPLQSRVQVIIAQRDGTVLSTLEGLVVHSKPAVVSGEAGSGMGLQFDQLDAGAQRAVAAFKSAGGQSRIAEAEPEGVWVESLDAVQAPGGVPILGIDLGTTFCCVAIIDGAEPRVLTDDGHETFPTVLYLDRDKRVVVGHKAVEKMILDPTRGVYGSKRFIGRPFASREVVTYGHFFNYTLTASKEGTVAAKLGKTVVPLETVAAYILSHVRAIAQKQLGPQATHAVITVPAYFGEGQRAAVRKAGTMAGLTVHRVLSEPTAAAVAYGFGRGLHKTILVYDLGGGTFDATVLRVEGNEMRVLATDGDPFLGGADFDDRLTEYILMHLERMHRVDLRKDKIAVQRVRLAAEKAKRELSEAPQTTIDLPYLAPGVNGKLTIEGALFASLTDDLVNRTFDIVQRVLDAAQVTTSQLDDVVMVGGQSRSPIIRERLQSRFGKQPSRLVHPDHAVAIGAARVAQARHSDTPLALTDVLPATLRLVHGDGTTEVLLPRGTPLPARVEIQVTSTQGADGAQRFRAALVSGEESQAARNTTVGEIVLPSTLALALTKTTAPVEIKVSEDGLLTASAKHPLTHETQVLEVALAEGRQPENSDDEELLELEDADVMAL